MSLGPGAGVGLVAGDILSQALIQTGLSNSIKLEADETSVIGRDNFLPCNIQTLANGLLSNVMGSSNTPIHQNIFPTTNLMSLEPMAPGPNPPNVILSRVECHTSSTGSSDDKDQYSRHMNSAVGVMHVSSGCQQNGATVNSIPPASVNMNVGGSLSNCDIGGSNNLDIDLGDLLSIPVDTPDIGPQSIPHSSSSYSVLGPTNPPVPFQTPGLSTQYQQNSVYQPIMSQTSAELPELEGMDLYNILGDSEPDFLDTLNVNSFSRSLETSYPHSSTTRPQINARPFSQFGSDSSGLVTFPPESQFTATKLEQSSSLANLTVGRLPHPIIGMGGQFVPPKPKGPSTTLKPFKLGPLMGSNVAQPAVNRNATKQVCLVENWY